MELLTAANRRAVPAARAASAPPRWWSGAGQAPLPLVVCACVVGLAVNLPLAYIVIRAVEGGSGPYLRHVLSPATLALTGQTLLLVAGVLAIALAISVPAAWLVARTDLPGRRAWAVLVALPLVFPSYVSAFALVAVFGPKGVLQGWLAPFGVTRLPDLVYGYSGALLALGLFTYPYVFLLLVAGLRSLDPALEETARALGANRWRGFWTVTLPQLRAPLLGGGLLVALYTVSDFGAVSIARCNTLTLSIYTAYRSLFDRNVAAAAATVLVVLALSLIAIHAALHRGVRPGRVARGAVRPPVPLGRWRWPSLIGLSLLALITLGVPLGVIGLWAARALRTGNALGTAGEAALRSAGVSVVAAGVALAAALPVALWSTRFRSRVARTIERLTYSGFALPGLVIALALVFFATRHARPIYQSVGLLVAAYVIRFLPEALSATRAALSAVKPELEEAGRSLGRSRLAVLTGVTLPLVRPGLLAGAGLVFLTTMKELPATLVLRPIGFETLATRVWSSAGEGVFSAAALPALLLVMVSAPPLYWLTIRPALGGRG